VGKRNMLARRVEPINAWPTPLRRLALTMLVGNVVPMVGTAGIRVEDLTIGSGTFFLPSRRKVQNHLRSLHAASMALLAETATGLVVGMSVRDDCVPVIKTLRVDYLKRTKGSLRAVATLSDEQRALIERVDKGEVTVPVTVTDETGRQTISCEMIWAWTPRRRT
jgi:acyl-coenzyme A thioesterase PaaI-like protein